MTTERRTTVRGSNASRVTFTDAASDTPVEGTLHDIGRGGMFVATASKLASGKRIEFEVHIAPAQTIQGMGRVIWTREASGDLPAGIGVKFIDVDNDALAAIDRIVGLKKNVRERTILGMTAPTPPAAPKAPSPEIRRPKVGGGTMIGMAPPAPPPRDQELSWPDEPPAAPPEPTPSPKAEAKAEPVATKDETESAPPVAVEPEPLNVEPDPEPAEPVLLASAESAEPEPVKHEPAPEPEPEARLRADTPKGLAPEARLRADTPKGLQSELVAEASEPEPPRKKAVSQPIVPRELPKREERGRGWMLALLLVVVAGVAVFLLRDHIAALFGPTVTPPTSAAPSVSAVLTTTAPPIVSAPPVDVVDASTLHEPTPNVDTEEVDASMTTTAIDAGPHDAGNHDHDGGHHHHDAGLHAHPHAHPSSTANDNPY